MPKPKRGPRLGGGPAHQRHILANQASDLFVHGRITTTLTKARTLRPYAEKLITKAKAGDLHSRRQVLAKLQDRDVVAYLFEDVGPRFAERNGGYTRILKLGPRKGDAAPMAIIELVEQADRSGEEAVEESKQGRMRGLFGRRRRRKPEAGGPDTAYLSDEFDEEEETSETSSETSESSESSESSEPEAAEEGADTEATDDAGLAAQAPSGPAQEPSAPDDPGAGAPVDIVDDEPDAGAATGKDVT